jgi:hypothetical protein
MIIGYASGFLNNFLEVSLAKSDIYAMPKKQEAQKKGGRPKLDKRTISIRLSNDVLAQARKASASGGNLSVYIEESIKARLKKDGIK